MGNFILFITIGVFIGNGRRAVCLDMTGFRVVSVLHWLGVAMNFRDVGMVPEQAPKTVLTGQECDRIVTK